MSSAFPAPIDAILPDRMGQRLKAAWQDVRQDLAAVNDRSRSLNASVSVLNRLLEDIWTLWVYPEWAPVGDGWDGPLPDEVDMMAGAVLATWDMVCEWIVASGEPPPYWTCSAGVSAATLRRAGLAQPLAALTRAERDAIRESLTRYSPGSHTLAPALWHAHDLGYDLSTVAAEIQGTPAPKQSDTDFKPHYTRVLHSSLCGNHTEDDRPRLRQDIANCIVQHYAWVANTGVDNVSLSFAAAVACGLEQCHPGLLPFSDPPRVRTVLSPGGIECLRA